MAVWDLRASLFFLLVTCAYLYGGPKWILAASVAKLIFDVTAYAFWGPPTSAPGTSTSATLPTPPGKKTPVVAAVNNEDLDNCRSAQENQTPPAQWGSPQNPADTSSEEEPDPSSRNANVTRRAEVVAAYDTLRIPSVEKRRLKKKIRSLQAYRAGKSFSSDDSSRETECQGILQLSDNEEADETEKKGKLYCRGEVGGVPVSLEVDSGSPITIIPLEIFNQIDPCDVKKMDTQDRVFTDYNGNQISTQGLFQLPLTLDNQVQFKTRVLVASRPGQGKHCLLGLDVLLGKRLSLINEDTAQVYLTIKVGSDARRKITLHRSSETFVKEDTILEPGEVTPVEVTLDSAVNRIDIGPSNKLFGTVVIGSAPIMKDLLLPQEGVYQIGDNATFFVPVINKTMGPFLLGKSDCIMKVQQLEPGTVLENTIGDQQTVLPSGKLTYSLTYTIDQLEQVIKTKQKIPQIEETQQAPNFTTIYRLKVDTSGLLLPDEKSIKEAMSSVSLAQLPGGHVAVTGRIQHSRMFTRHLLTKILEHDQTAESRSLCVDITACPTLRNFIIQGYYLVATGLERKPKKLLLLNRTENLSLSQKFNPIHSVHVGNGGDTPDSGSVSESDLCEPLFQKMSPLHPNPSFWQELLSGAPEHLQPQLLHLLASKHKDVFPKSSVDFGDCTLPNSEFRIHLTTQEGFSTKPYPLNNVYSRIVEETMDEMCKAGLLKEEASSYGSGVFVRPRADPTGGTGCRVRLIYDLRKLNLHTVKDSFPLPNIRSLLQSLQGKKYFGLIDLKDSYQSIRIHPEDTKKAAVVTAKSVYLPQRLGYGFTSAPAHFSRTIARVLKRVDCRPGQMVQNYLDDLLIASNTPEELVDLLDKVLYHLRTCGFKVNLSKMVIFKRRIKILGFIFEEGGISSDPMKINAIKKMPPPTTVSQMRRFLGCCNYHAELVPNFAKLSDPLLAYVANGTPDNFKLDPKALQAFEALKEALAKPVRLNLIDPQRPVYLETDASGVAWGAVAYQVAAYDRSCIDKLKAAHEELQNLSRERVNEKLQEMIKEYVQTGKLPNAPGVPTSTNETPEFPFLTSPLKSKPQGDVFYVVEINFFYSRKFSRVQHLSWSSLAKELVSILITVERKADLLLMGTELLICTDAKSCVYLYQQSSGHALMSRYMARLSSYPFRILVRHKDGKHLLLADTISRAWTLDVDADNPDLRVPHTQGILVEVPFPPGSIVSPADILAFVQKGESNVVRSSSDPSISKASQTSTKETPKKTPETCPKISSSVMSVHKASKHTQTGTREGVPNRVPRKSPAVKTRIHRIHLSVKREVDRLTDLSQYLKYQRLEFPEILEKLQTFDASSQYKLENGLILVMKNDQWRRYTPPSLRTLVLLKAHLRGHLGATKMEEILKQTDYWPNMLKDCENFTSSCLSCLFVRPPRGGTISLGEAVATGPNEVWQVDLVSGLPTSKHNEKFFCSVIDTYTKFLIILPLKQDEALHIAETLEQRAFAVLGVPKFLVTDGASNLAKSLVFKSLAAFYGFELRIRTPYSSRSLGAVERVHRSVLDCIRSYKDQFHIDWATSLPMINLIYNNTKHSAIGCTPAEMVFGRRQNLWSWTPEEIAGTKWTESEYCDQNTEELEHIRSHAKKLQDEYSLKMRDRFGGKNLRAPPGVFVLALDKSPAKKTEKIKLRLRYTGPFLIHQEFEKTVLAESCRTGKLGYLHKSFLRVIPEKDAERYESMPALAKLKMGGGHTYAEWQNLLHQDALLQTLDREKHPGTEYGIEDLAGLAADEDCTEALDRSQPKQGPITDQTTEDLLHDNLDPVEDQNLPNEDPGTPSVSISRPTTGSTTSKRVTFNDVDNNPRAPAEEPRRSGRNRQLPLRFRDN